MQSSIYAWYITSEKKTLQEANSEGIKKIAKYSSGGADYNKLPGSFSY